MPAREPWYVAALQGLAWAESGPVAFYACTKLLATLNGRFGPEGVATPALAVVGAGATVLIVMAAIGSGRRRPWAARAMLTGQLGLVLICAIMFASAAGRDNEVGAVLFAVCGIIAVVVGAVAGLAARDQALRA